MRWMKKWQHPLNHNHTKPLPLVILTTANLLINSSETQCFYMTYVLTMLQGDNPKATTSFL